MDRRLPLRIIHTNSQTEPADVPAGLLTATPPSKQRRRKQRSPDALDVKRDSASPPERSASGSPRSLCSQRSPPAAAGGGGGAGGLGGRLSPHAPHTPLPAAAAPHPPRNYSDFMRSLAAKYNNNNNASGTEYFPSAAASAAGLLQLRGFDYSRYGLKPGGGSPLLPAAGAEKARVGADEPPVAPPLLPVAGPLAALSGLPMLDVLSLVRGGPGCLAAVTPPAVSAPTPPTSAASKRPADAASPLDLSNMKRPRLEKTAAPGFKELFGLKDAEERTSPRPAAPAAAEPERHHSACLQKPCSPQAEAVAAWSVDQVAAFVRSVQQCAEYAQLFREHGIDGSTLPLLRAEHLTGILHMRLGAALRLRQAVSARTGQCATCQHCRHCHQPPTPPPASTPAAVNVSSAAPALSVSVSAAAAGSPSPRGFLPFAAASRPQ